VGKIENRWRHGVSRREALLSLAGMLVGSPLLGAQGVLVARPVMWDLAAYGADGVQSVLELLQSAFARTMGSIGAPNLASLDRTMVKIHTR
jgi:isopentenyl diphosphate isomerase/L-lactate dehydrogenase-like FMN-dependent dehydrogenase